MIVRTLVVLALLAPAAAGCGDAPTRIVVAVYSDLEVPAELDEVRVVVTDASGRPQEPAVGVLQSPADLPQWVTVVQRESALGPILVTVTGFQNGTVVVARTARVELVDGQTRILRIELARACIGVVCPPGDTCEGGSCRPVDVRPAELLPWTGEIGDVDASVPPPPDDVCPDGRGDCDGRSDNGCETDLATMAACGQCDHPCSEVGHGSAACVDRACRFTCEEGWADCDGLGDNGCEADLGAAQHCGACGHACPDGAPLCNDPGDGTGECLADCLGGLQRCDTSCVDLATDEAHCGGCFSPCADRPNATPVCAEARCGYVCAPGFGDCDGVDANGCERALDTLSDCGSCGARCTLPHATATCSGGVDCRVSDCDDGFGDCNRDPADGCEMPLQSVTHCGGCGVTCALPNAVASCSSGRCTLAECMPGFGDCNGEPSDGCEAPLTTLGHCGACGAFCALFQASESCAGGTCAIGSCEPGFGDCDGADANGCETALNTRTDCGGCGVACVLPRATSTCAARICEVATCVARWGDCNGTAADGCETDLSTAANCGACGRTCSGATPLCDGVTGSCVSGCGGSTPDRCGASCVDTTSDPAHCGSCGMACTVPHATPRCTARTCGIGSCDAGWSNCNGSAADGCETPTTTLTDCGGCGMACTRANATATCATGSCRIVACTAGYDDCDMMDPTGCERALTTLTDCGRCGGACSLPNATASCTTGSCALVSCSAGYGDCDMVGTNGCETALSTLADCGGCGVTCDLANATESCASGSCALVACDPGWADCDMMPGNGCEQDVSVTPCP